MRPGRGLLKEERRWPVGQAVKTAASHAANMGSIPVRVTKFSLQFDMVLVTSVIKIVGAD